MFALQGFRASVTFVRETPSCLVEPDIYKLYVGAECDRILSEIARLEKGMETPNKRLENVMNLVSTHSFVMQYSSC
jgi:hypothetical protein